MNVLERRAWRERAVAGLVLLVVGSGLANASDVSVNPPSIDPPGTVSPPGSTAPGPGSRVCDEAYLPASQRVNVDFACGAARATTQRTGLVAWTNVNDGAGSGLEADLLDGLSSEDFLARIDAEAAARRAADDAIGGRIDEEGRLWRDAINALRAEMEGERLRRDVLEQTLRGFIVEEAAGRARDVRDLALQIKAEAAARAAADDALRVDVFRDVDDLAAAIAAEENARRSDVAALSRLVGDEPARRQEGDWQLHLRVDGVQSRVGGIEGFVNGGDLAARTATLTAGATFAGNVGIGTSMPVAGLHVRGRAGPAATLRISGEDDGKGSNARMQFGGGEDVIAEIRSHYHNSAENGVGELQFLTRRATSDPALTPAVVILPSGNVGIGTASPAAPLHVRPPPGGGAGIVIDPPEAEADSTLKLRTAGVDRGFLSADGAHVTLRSTGFLSLHAGGLSSERVRITSAGNVGIGTTAPDPAHSLHVVAPGESRIAIETRSPSAFAGLDFYGATAEGRFGLADIQAKSMLHPSDPGSLTLSTNSPDMGRIIFRTGDHAEAMRIMENGNVGIGTTRPLDRVHVEAAQDIHGRGSLGTTNLIFDGGAESGGLGWISTDFDLDGSTGRGTVDSEHPYSGSRIFRAYNDGGLKQSVEVVPGATYTLSGRARVLHVDHSDVSVGHLVAQTVGGRRDLADHRCPINDFDAPPNLGKWLFCSVTFVAPGAADAKTTTIEVGFRAGGYTHTAVFDNLMLVRGGLAQDYNPITTAHTGALLIADGVGIGTRAPNAKLAVAGDIKASGPISANADVPLGDVAEPVVGEGLEPGDVVVLDGFDPSGKLRVRRAATALDPGVVGIVSTNPSLRLAGLATDLPLAVTGIVPVKVVGPVAPGDLLAASDVPGRARACLDAVACYGRTIGKAMEGLEAGEGVVRAMVVVG